MHIIFNTTTLTESCCILYLIWQQWEIQNILVKVKYLFFSKITWWCNFMSCHVSHSPSIHAFGMQYVTGGCHVSLCTRPVQIALLLNKRDKEGPKKKKNSSLHQWILRKNTHNWFQLQNQLHRLNLTCVSSCREHLMMLKTRTNFG